MPASLSRMHFQEAADAALTSITFPFGEESAELSLVGDAFLSFDIPRDAEGKRMSVRRLYDECAELLRPLQVPTEYFDKTKLLLLAILSAGGNMCTMEQTKGNLLWMCIIFVMDDFFDGKRAANQQSLIAAAEAIRPKYDNAIPAELDAQLCAAGRAMVETVRSIRYEVIRPLFRSRLVQFEAGFDKYMEGIVRELQCADNTTDEKEYLKVRVAYLGMEQFLEMYWDFHGASEADIAAAQRVSELGQIIAAVDNDIISHAKTVRERDGEPVYDYVTLYGGTLAAAQRSRNVLYDEYRREVLLCGEGNTALKGVCDLVAANLVFSATSRRYLARPVDIRRFFREEVATYFVEERLVSRP